MNRSLLVMVVGLSMTMAACAADVDDPLPPVAVPEEQRKPPERSLSTELRDPQALLMDAIEVDVGLGRVPPKQVPPRPGPLPGPLPEED